MYYSCAAHLAHDHVWRLLLLLLWRRCLRRWLHTCIAARQLEVFAKMPQLLHGIVSGAHLALLLWRRLIWWRSSCHLALLSMRWRTTMWSTASLQWWRVAVARGWTMRGAMRALHLFKGKQEAKIVATLSLIAIFIPSSWRVYYIYNLARTPKIRQGLGRILSRGARKPEQT